MIPNSSHQLWNDLLTEKHQPTLSSLSLQMKLNALKFAVKYNKISLDEAIEDLYRFCANNAHMYQKDVNTIFNLF